MIALAVLALLLAGVAAFALTRPSTAKVPNVLGDPVEVARAKIQEAGFEFAQRPAPTCSPANTVTEQDPPAAAEAEEGSTVTVTVSLGLAVNVPDVVGEPEAAADEAARGGAAAGAEPGQALAATSRPGRVISTQPAAGTEVECKSTGDDLRLQGGEHDLAARRGRPAAGGGRGRSSSRLGLIVNVDTRDADEPEGTVIDQDPGGRRRAPAQRPGDDRRLQRRRLGDRARRRSGSPRTRRARPSAAAGSRSTWSSRTSMTAATTAGCCSRRRRPARGCAAATG